MLEHKDCNESEVRGILSLMEGKVIEWRHLADEWEARFGHWDKGISFDGAIDALEADDKEGAERALRVELEALRLPALIDRAKDAGIESTDMKDADGGDMPKAEIINLIIATVLAESSEE